MRTYRQSLVASGSQRRNRDICLANKGYARKCQQVSRVELSRNKSLDASSFIVASRVPVIGRDGCDFAFGVEFRKKLILYLPAFRQSTTPLCCDHRKRDSSLFVSIACTHTSLFLRHNCLSHIQLRKKNKQDLFMCVLFKEKYEHIGFART